MPPKRKGTGGGDAPSKVARTDGIVWSREFENNDKLPVIFYRYDPKAEGRSKVVAFDIDWTIIQTASGKKFATGKDDWKWWSETVPKKLRELHEQGYRILFFSNQGGVEKGKTSMAEMESKVDAIAEKAGLGPHIFAFLSTGESHYRKPSVEMFQFFVGKCNGGVKVDLSESKYVGDAAGRPKDWSPGKPKDFSCSDRMFAANVGLPFATPEEYFLGWKPAKFSWGSLDPSSIPSKEKDSIVYTKSGQELVVLMGMPASGKSSFFQRHFAKAGYVHINRDTLSTPAKCLKVAKESVSAGKSVVVDNTNPSKSARADYIKLAKDNKIPVRCIHLTTSKEVARHLNYLRQNRTRGKVRRIPDVGYGVYNKNLEPPTTAEGFSEVLELPFVPHFEDDEHKRLFLQWTA